MEVEIVILLAVASWLLVAVAMLWGMLRVARRHARDAHEQQLLEQPRRTEPAPRRKPRRPKPLRPGLAPALRAAQHLAHR